MAGQALPSALTPEQKLRAFQCRFYERRGWTPRAGDLYTTTRADLELYVVEGVSGGKIYTARLADPVVVQAFRDDVPVPGDRLSEWGEAGFATREFGPQRLWVPPWALDPAWEAPSGWHEDRGQPDVPESAMWTLRARLKSAAHRLRVVLAITERLTMGLNAAADEIASVAADAEMDDRE